jgi:2-hydroxychromene-2-carboxylate isomerase
MRTNRHTHFTNSDNLFGNFAMPDIEYYYSAHSAFAWLGHAKLLEIAAHHNARINHKPMHLNSVVAAVNPDGFAKRSKAHINYYFGREIERWGEYRGVAFKGGIPTNHGNSTTLANCLLIACAEQGDNTNQLAQNLLEAHWRDHADLADETTLIKAANAAGLNAESLLNSARSDTIKTTYRTNTTQAIEQNVFGSPTYIVNGDMFYGQDHLELVERALVIPFGRTWVER